MSLTGKPIIELRNYKQTQNLVYDDFGTWFSDILLKNGSFTVHHTNIDTLT